MPTLLQADGWDVRAFSRRDSAGLAGFANDLRRSDLIYVWGGRVSLGKFLSAARLLNKKKLVMLWAGSDVFYAREQTAAGKMDPWIREKIHWAVSPWIAEEVRALGLPCEHVQVSFAHPVAKPAPLPGKFSVLVYIPGVTKGNLYGWDRVLEVAKRMRSIEFVVVGIEDDIFPVAPSNVKFHGRIADLTGFFQRASAVWRPVRHDGLSFMVLEALAHGRHVVYTYPFPACRHAPDNDSACAEIQRLAEAHAAGTLELNTEGMRLIASEYRPDKVRAEILGRWQRILEEPASTQSLLIPAPQVSSEHASFREIAGK
ncbi:MAG TPA: glycosyltransferase [Candidatus Acidoferrales bacterium]